ncbi:Short-chain dehydrogenase ptmH [Paramyrothecium foliicola]|nr:Short-chain dehydrogenase ptmH [Paramyrothecium foliicola]
MANQRTVLVTGCSDGSLGSALALALQAAGWRVFASARSLAKLTVVQNANIECIQLDVLSDQSIAEAVGHVKKLTGGSLDGLINNAGAGYSMPIIHADLSRTREMFELNFFSVISLTQAFLPLLMASRQGPILVNNTSAAALLNCAPPFQGAYTASKAAAASITDTLRLELAPFGIKVVNLVTGAVQSSFYRNITDARLPVDSIYAPAREAIEAGMNGDQGERCDAALWAKQVAQDISKPKPPHMVFRGTKAGVARVATLLPTGLSDPILKQLSKLDVLERKFKEQRFVRL